MWDSQNKNIALLFKNPPWLHQEEHEIMHPEGHEWNNAAYEEKWKKEKKNQNFSHT